ncbi:esterase FE4-like [Chelonus insularis]|uniref:esterase FE4-like n=1 Tax=Chelonus insularis TaxID=460826 RepID=UPI00158D561C|nr:esterase FE4-like [Chelonus insularis]
MRTFVILICGLLLSCGIDSINATHHNETVEVNVSCDLGRVRGSEMTSRLGRKIYAFRGVRYAEPPVDDLRFKTPVPVKPWTVTFDATQEGPMCPQPKDPNRNDPMSEDCLRLNIYTTQLPTRNSILKPVIVFIHPGAFVVSSGQSLMWGPEYFLDKDIVLVTVNYRLASLGFMSTGDEYAPGNLGLKDQVIALRFIRDNIASFGGDPNSVTITGYSAGAWCVSAHLVSPMSQGLFHRVISMSGAIIFQTDAPSHQKHLAEKQARFLNCSTESSKAIIDCLKTKPAQEIADTLSMFAESNGYLGLQWRPVVEPDLPGLERFLPAQPVDLIRQRKFAQVPLIVGVTKDEFAGFLAGAIEQAEKGNTSIFDNYSANWTQLAPFIAGYERDTPRSLEISREFKRFYLNDEPVSLKNIQRLGQLNSDGAVIFGVHRLANLISQYSNQPVYYYKFAYQGRFSYFTWSNKTALGVCHQDDLQYLFFIKALFPFFDSNAPEVPMVEKMTSMWANFAYTGQPIPQDKKEFAGVSWTPLTPENKAYMEIDSEMTMKRGLYQDRMEEWEKLFPLAPVPK